MKLSPRHDAPAVLVDRRPDPDVGRVAVAQRRRFTAALARLDAEAWAAPTRCAGWSVRDVAAHLATVNGYWVASMRAALDGAPLRLLVRFDPVTTPPLLLLSMEAHEPAAVQALLEESTEAFAAAVRDIGDAWDHVAETPLGHVPLRSLAAHALWDSWVHERDIFVPLGDAPPEEPAEVAACLRYAAGMSAAIALLHDLAPLDPLAVAVHDPAAAFVIEAATDAGTPQVVLHDGPAAGRPVLEGPATPILEWLSIRADAPVAVDPAWQVRRDVLATAFDLG